MVILFFVNKVLFPESRKQLTGIPFQETIDSGWLFKDIKTGMGAKVRIIFLYLISHCSL